MELLRVQVLAHDQEFLLEQDVEKNMQECINA